MDAPEVYAEAAWQERQDAEAALRDYLHDLPSERLMYYVFLSRYISPIANIAFLYGPQGSGKSKMLSRILQEKKRYIPLYLPA